MASVPGWRLTGIFGAVILSFLLRTLQMGPTVIVGIVVAAVTGVLPMKELTAGYGQPVVWLVVGAFLIAGAVQSTGLGSRIAWTLIHRWGRTRIGLGYAICGAELVLGPVVPSNTARGGGILAPIVDALARAVDAADQGAMRRWLIFVGAHANLVTAAMFLTGMAANPLLATAAKEVAGVEFTWARWALGAVVPGSISLALLPILLGRLVPALGNNVEPARGIAHAKLKAMGPLQPQERRLAAILATLLLLWSTKGVHGLGTTVVAWIGVSAMLLLGIRTWEDVTSDGRAWDALVWLGGLLAMAIGLKTTGMVQVFATAAEGLLAGYAAMPTLLGIALVYFYSMYGFSMLTAHISALAGAFLALAIAAGAPPLLTVGILAYFSNLCACTTHYSTGPVILYFGLGHVPVGHWYRVGLVVSWFQLLVWLGIGLPWWHFLGWW